MSRIKSQNFLINFIIVFLQLLVSHFIKLWISSTAIKYNMYNKKTYNCIFSWSYQTWITKSMVTNWKKQTKYDFLWIQLKFIVNYFCSCEIDHFDFMILYYITIKNILLDAYVFTFITRKEPLFLIWKKTISLKNWNLIFLKAKTN